MDVRELIYQQGLNKRELLEQDGVRRNALRDGRGLRWGFELSNIFLRGRCESSR